MTSTLDQDQQVRNALQGLLTPLATQQPTAREAYAAMIRLVARLDGDIPTGSRLVNLVQLFNAQRPVGIPAIPTGTAGVAQDCVAAFRRSLISQLSAGVTHPSLPVDLQENLNHWLERLLELMQTQIRQPYEHAATELRQQHQKELQAIQDTATAEQAQAEAAVQVANALQKQQLQQLELLTDKCTQQTEQLQAQAQQLAQEGELKQALQDQLTAAQTQINALHQQQAKIQAAFHAAQHNADNERRQHLLVLDTARVMEQDLVREKEKRKAAENLNRTLEKYLEEEKTLNADWQNQVQEMQLQLTRLSEMHQITGPYSGNRMNPARRSAAAAIPQRKKTLRRAD